MIEFLREATCNDKTGRASSSRITMLCAGFTLCVCTLFLTVASFWRIELVPALTVLGGILGTMGGAGYVAQRMNPNEDKP